MASVADKPNRLRRVILRPYRKGAGPVFALTTWYTGRTDEYGKSILRYRLTMNGAVLFLGEDYHCSPMDAIDSDGAVAGLLGFLTVRPGDTDSEYFADYTKAQMDYAENHAEALACCVMDRFGEH